MISIVIPTYKNREMFAANLEHNMSYFGSHEVIIVNDDPGASIAPDMKEYESIILIENGQNLGFAGAANKGIRAAHNPYVLLLNSDVRLQDMSYEKSCRRFAKDDTIFALSYAQAERNGNIVGRNRIFWRNGFMQHEAVSRQKETENGWAEGGSMLLDKSKFDALHGFDELYAPFYWEDIDLSYRAWKSGYRVLYDPSVEVIHHHESTIGTYFGARRVKKIAYRNQLMFIWKNISDSTLMKSHLAALPRHLLYSTVRFDTPFVTGFAGAVWRLPAVLKSRQAARQHTVRTDREILDMFR